MSEAPAIQPHLRFQMEKIEAEMNKGLRIEAAPLGPFYRLRFFNDVESVMLIGNQDQLRQIHREIGNALDLGVSRVKRGRRARQAKRK